ncbi:MAG TPA: hypothetical protein VHL98_00445 [Microvirga sp.]|jgi:hypothetical protein|nr:hypothetical protein [Microvirga sp.]
MSRPGLAFLAVLASLLPAAAQEPRIWRDPDQGCTYVITAQGGIGLRYRRDGAPDCPEWTEASRLPSAIPGPAVAPRMVPVAPVIWSGTPRTDTPGVRPSETWSGARVPDMGGMRPSDPRGTSGPADLGGLRPSDPWGTVRGSEVRNRPLVWPGEGPSDSLRTREAALVLPQNFGCWASGDNPRSGVPAQVRVRVEPQARVILVDTTGGREILRYTLDSTGDVWFNGRNERDPRLGIILSPSRGHMWLDSSARPGSRGGDIISQPFDCRPEGTVY